MPRINKDAQREHFIKYDKDLIEAARKKDAETLDKVKFAPVEAQIAFIKELIKKPKEAEDFLRNPKKYTIEHGILLDPKVVKTIVNNIIFDASLDEKVVKEYDINSVRDIVDMREGNVSGPYAMPAAVAAGAAVVAAVAAVVTMVVTLVRTKKPKDLIALQGLGDKGILLPGKTEFISRAKINSRMHF